MRVNGEALQLCEVYSRIFTTSQARIRIRYYKSHENPYQVLQVTCASECAMKSKVCMVHVVAEMCYAVWLTLQGNVVH